MIDTRSIATAQSHTWAQYRRPCKSMEKPKIHLHQNVHADYVIYGTYRHEKFYSAPFRVFCSQIRDSTCTISRGLHGRGCSGQIASLTHDILLSFFPFLVTPTGRIFGHIPTHNTSLYIVPWGWKRRNLKCDMIPFTPFPKKRKKLTLSWRSMENCNSHDSGTVCHIHRIHVLITQVSSHDNSKIKRSKVNDTRSRNLFS